MANETTLTIVGYLTADPDLKSTSSGFSVVNITIATTPSKFDRNTNQWVEGETLFMRASAWRHFAEAIASSLRKGDKVIAQGRLIAQSYTDKEGNARTTTQLELDSLGMDLSRPPKSGYAEAPKAASSAFEAPSDWMPVESQVPDDSPF